MPHTCIPYEPKSTGPRDLARLIDATNHKPRPHLVFPEPPTTKKTSAPEKQQS